PAAAANQAEDASSGIPMPTSARAFRMNPLVWAICSRREGGYALAFVFGTGRLLPGMGREADAMCRGCEAADDHIRVPAEWILEGLRYFFAVPATEFCECFCPTDLEDSTGRGSTIVRGLTTVGDDKISKTENPAGQDER